LIIADYAKATDYTDNCYRSCRHLSQPSAARVRLSAAGGSIPDETGSLRGRRAYVTAADKGEAGKVQRQDWHDDRKPWAAGFSRRNVMPSSKQSICWAKRASG